MWQEPQTLRAVYGQEPVNHMWQEPQTLLAVYGQDPVNHMWQEPPRSSEPHVAGAPDSPSCI
jgi:hypothetical protein